MRKRREVKGCRVVSERNAVRIVRWRHSGAAAITAALLMSLAACSGGSGSGTSGTA